MSGAVELPDGGDGSRSRRRLRRRRRRVGTGVAAVVVAALLLGVLSLLGDAGSGEIRSAAPVATLPPEAEDRPPALPAVAVNGADGSLLGVAVLVRHPGGGEVVHVPVDLAVPWPAGGTLRDAATGGPGALAGALANALGARVAATVLDPQRLAEALLPAGELLVELADGTQEVLVPSTAVAFLEVPAPSGLAHLVRFQSFWAAWLAAVAARPSEAAPPPGVLGDAAAAVVAIAAGEVGHAALPVAAVTSAGGRPRYEISGPDMDALVARLLPGATAYTSRRTVRLEDAGGDQTHAALVDAVGRVGGAGVGRVVETARIEAPSSLTTVTFASAEARDAAAALAEALGAGRVERGTPPPGVDLTVTLGADYEPTIDEGASTAGS